MIKLFIKIDSVNLKFDFFSLKEIFLLEKFESFKTLVEEVD